MKRITMSRRSALALLAGVGLSASAFPTTFAAEPLGGKIAIDGSSTVFKLSQAVAQEFSRTNKGVAIKVDKSGTGGGFKKFVTGSLDICDASRPIQEKEMADCKKNGVEYIELPICFDAVTIAVNAKNAWCDSMTTAELKKLWEPAADKKVTKWSQIREGWPDEKIALFGQGTDSGTFEYFTEVINEKKGASRSDYTASEDDNVIVLGVEGNKNALGYLPYAYYAARTKTMKAVKIEWSGHEKGAVLPSPETVKSGKYSPLSRPLFIYINLKAAKRPEIKAFVDFYIEHGYKMSEVVKYIPLEKTAYKVIEDRFDSLKTGTGFGGKTEFGLPIEEILKREPKS
jgi:phosphate transport system substrate-binding protein